MHDKYLTAALEQARVSARKGGFPAGAVVVKNGVILSSGQSLGHVINDPTSHGEIAAIRAACSSLQSSSLEGCVLYTSLEPCNMCKSAAFWAGITDIFYITGKETVDNDYYEQDILHLTQDDSLDCENKKLFS